jgi:hypothetical protein
MIQVWGDEKGIYPKILEDRRREPTKPTGLGEGSYEDGPQYPTRPIDAHKVRAQAYWSYLAGGYHTYGNTNTWNFGSYKPEATQGWEDALHSPGAEGLSVLAKVLTPLPWWRLIPDRSVLASGAGDGEAWKAATRSADGDLLLAYLPGPGAVELDLGRITAGGPARATWIDPRSGDRATAGEFPAEGRRRFTTPGGWQDALLIVAAGSRR